MLLTILKDTGAELRLLQKLFHFTCLSFPKPLPLVTIEIVPKENCGLELCDTKPQPSEADAIWGKADQDIAKKHEN